MAQSDINHCVAKIAEIALKGEDDRRSVLQLGYNLGRLSELTGLGREPFWDRWKDAVGRWDREELRGLVHGLHEWFAAWRPIDPAAP
jgi:hypothetical protein